MAFKGPIYEWSTTAGDNDDIDSTINYRERQQPSTLNDSARALMARLKAFVSLLGGTSGGGGTANAYTIASPVGHEWAEYAKGQLVMLEVPSATTNTGASTLKIDGLSALPITFPDGAAVAAGDLAAGGSYLMRCTGTAFHIVGGQSEVSSFMRGLLDDPDAATARGTLGITGNLAAVTATAYALTILAAADAAAARTLLGVTATGSDTTYAYRANNLSDLASATTARTNLGVGTADSPQFLAVNIGHASDTTLARVSAGILSVEGSTLFSASNLPGTAITWTAAQTFSGLVIANRPTATANPDNSGSATTNIQARLGASNVGSGGYGIDIGVSNADGSVWVQARDWSNFATNSTLRLQPNGGIVTIGGNTAYHAGNLAGTNVNWSAAQTFNATVTVNAAIYSQGAGSALYFEDRTNAAKDWAWYATGGLAYLFSPTAGNVLYVTEAGELVYNANVSPTNVRALGYLGTNPVTRTSSYTLALSDAGCRQYCTATLTATIPTNASVPFPIGTIIPFSGTAGTQTVAPAGGVTLYRMDGSGSTGSRTLSNWNVAYIEKISTNEWVAVGFTG